MDQAKKIDIKRGTTLIRRMIVLALTFICMTVLTSSTEVSDTNELDMVTEKIVSSESNLDIESGISIAAYKKHIGALKATSHEQDKIIEMTRKKDISYENRNKYERKQESFCDTKIALKDIPEETECEDTSCSFEENEKTSYENDVTISFKNIIAEENNCELKLNNTNSSKTGKKDIKVKNDSNRKEEDGETYVINGREYTLSEYQIDILCMLVQSEVGYSASYFPNSDFAAIQQMMTRTVVNRLNRKGFSDTLEGVIEQPGQFRSIEALKKKRIDGKLIDPKEKTTRENVMTVLNGKDGLSENSIWEMSFSKGTTLESALKKMEKGLGTKVSPTLTAITADGRLLIFAEPAN